jgi:aerobic-type carbon monoxide dehydrogenase small subunit (CoxS/CutS family)
MAEAKLTLTVNGREISVEAAPDARLLDVLRLGLGLTGVREGCGEGECGACSVLLDGRVVNACLYPAWAAAGATVVTAEGTRGVPEYERIREALLERGVVQCGFCMPGFVISIASLLKDDPAPTREAILEGISGNLCRCTGYLPVVEAVEALMDVAAAKAPTGGAAPVGGGAP